MTSYRPMIWIALALAAVAGTAGCTLDSPTYITSQDSPITDGTDAGSSASSSSTASPSAAAGGAAATCSTTDFVKPDLASLTACGDGKGHCFAKDKVSLASMLTACPNAAEVCVPDEILQAGGQPLKTCSSIIGAGGCVTATLIPEIVKQAGGALKPDVCSATQLCVPCTDPTHGNAPTPFCQPIGVHQNACSADAAGGADGGAAALPPTQPCCTTNGKSNGVCIAETAVPEAQRSQTKQDACTTGNKCVPAAFVAGKPVTCSGGLLGAGVCMDQCFNDMMKFAGGIGILSSAGCGTTEVCVPCGLVSGQGVPGCK
jgi:hypothetical protein